MKFKTIEELDLMSRGDILVHRDDILTEMEDDDVEARRYADEVAFYIDVRFKDEFFKRLQNIDTKYGFKPIENGDELQYMTTLANGLPEDNTFKYITPMVLPDDITIEQLIKIRDFWGTINKK